MRLGAFLIVLCSIGCVHKPLPRWLVVTDPRVEIQLDDTTATAVVGDSVYVEVGPIVLDPDSKGYEVSVDGRKLSHPEWDVKNSDLRFRYRTKTVGEHQIEITIPQKGGEPRRRTCVVNVIE